MKLKSIVSILEAKDKESFFVRRLVGFRKKALVWSASAAFEILSTGEDAEEKRRERVEALCARCRTKTRM